MNERHNEAHVRRQRQSPAGLDVCGLPGCGTTFPIDVIDGWPHFTFVGEGEDRRRVRFCTEEHRELYEDAAIKAAAA